MLRRATLAALLFCFWCFFFDDLIFFFTPTTIVLCMPVFSSFILFWIEYYNICRVLMMQSRKHHDILKYKFNFIMEFSVHFILNFIEDFVIINTYLRSHTINNYLILGFGESSFINNYITVLITLAGHIQFKLHIHSSSLYRSNGMNIPLNRLWFCFIFCDFVFLLKLT